MIKLSDRQKEACLSNGNVLINATAGSGKTTVLVTRIRRLIYEGIRPENILAIAFNRKTRQDIKEKLSKYTQHVNVETFHSLAYRVIANEGYTLMKSYQKEALIESIFDDPSGITFHNVTSIFSKAKANMEIPTVYTDQYWKYEYSKKRNRLIEYDDFFELAMEVFKNSADVLSYYRNKYKYVLIDEYQDISKCQATFMDMINSDNTMVVGDGFQAIYSFRGGSSDFLRNFPVTHKNTTVVNMNENRRCSQEILRLANTLALEIPDSKSKYYLEPISLNGSYGFKPVYEVLQNEKEEAVYIASEIKCLDEKENCAILARTNRQFEIIQRVLHAENIPFEMIDGGLFTDIPELKLMINYIRLVNNQADDEAFEYVFNKPPRRMDEKFLSLTKARSKSTGEPLFTAMLSIPWKYKRRRNKFYNEIKECSEHNFRHVGTLVKRLRKIFKIDDYCMKKNPESDEVIDNLDCFQEMCSSYKTIPELLTYLEDLRSSTTNGGVKLSTVHKSKGLEFDAVFVCGCNDGIFPHIRSENEDDEKRLFYVAITRAKKRLYLTGTECYRGKYADESPFIGMCGLAK